MNQNVTIVIVFIYTHTHIYALMSYVCILQFLYHASAAIRVQCTLYIGLLYTFDRKYTQCMYRVYYILHDMYAIMCACVWAHGKFYSLHVVCYLLFVLVDYR